MRSLLLILTLLMGLAPAHGLVQDEGPIPDCEADFLRSKGIRIYVVTMSPGKEVFSVFGHNGVWVSDVRGFKELVYNYGTFSDKDPELLRKFIQGELIYWLATRSYAGMMRFYQSFDRTVAVQELLLPNSIKKAMVERLEYEALPEHREYDYHWFAANCTTKIRDLIDRFSGGDFQAQHREPTDITARDEVLRHFTPHPLFWFAWTFAVGDADRPLDGYELMFLPDRFMDGLARSTFAWPDGERRPLVGPPCIIHRGAHDWPASAPPGYTLPVWLLGLALAGLLAGLGLAARRHIALRVAFGLLTALFGLVASAAGSAALWAWLTARYAGYSNNENLFFAHPASLLLVLCGVLIIGGWRPRWVRNITTALAGVALVGALIALFTAQDSGPPMGLFLPPLIAIALAMHRPQGREAEET